MDRNHGLILTRLAPLALGVMMIASAVAQDRQRGEGRQRGERHGRGPGQMLKQMDKDGDGKISKEEFSGPERFFDRMDADKDGFITEKELAAMRGRGGRRGGARGDYGAPKVGDAAPTFKIKSLDGKHEFDLASFNGKRPVVLFFGSYT